MALDLTVVGGPIFLGRSRVNADSRDFGTFSASSMQSILPRIVDGDPFSYWQSATGDDTTTETIEVTVQTKSAKVAKSVDFLALQNFNGKRFKIEWKAGAGAYAIIPGADYTGSDWSGTDFLLNFTAIEPDSYLITILTTQSADDWKRLGGFYACQSALQLTTGNLQKYDKRFRETVRKLNLGDGTEDREYTFRSAASYEHYGSAVEIRYATLAERDALRTLKRSGEVFTFVPEPYDAKRDIFTCNFSGAWRDKYISSYKGAGYLIGFNPNERGEL